MPLDKSGSKESVGKNIAELQSSGRPHRQAVAIALDVQRHAVNALKVRAPKSKRVRP